MFRGSSYEKPLLRTEIDLTRFIDYTTESCGAASESDFRESYDAKATIFMIRHSPVAWERETRRDVAGLHIAGRAS